MKLASPANGLIQEAVVQLESAGVHRPQWTAEQLLARRLGCLPVEVYALAHTVPEAAAILFQTDVAARAHGMPLQYVMGSALFYGREFSVGPGVFSTRPETEILVETAINILMGRPATIIDVGTGSGAIAITLALECPEAKVIATDVSKVALKFARKNAQALGAQVEFLERDLLTGLAPESAELIVANLPYLNPAQAAAWPRELAWEPWLALDGGIQGLDLIGQLLAQAKSVLKPQGTLLLEIGADQPEQVQVLVNKAGMKVETTLKDLGESPRIVVVKRISC